MATNIEYYLGSGIALEELIKSMFMFDDDDELNSIFKNVAQSPADSSQDPTTIDAQLTEYLSLNHSGVNQPSQRGLSDMHDDGIHGPQEIVPFMLKKRKRSATTLSRVFHCSSKVPSKRARTCDDDDDSLSNTVIENKRKREMNASTDTWTRTARPPPRSLSVHGVRGLITILLLCTGKIRVLFLPRAEPNPVNFVNDHSTLAVVLAYSSRCPDFLRFGFDHFGREFSVSRLKLDYGQSWQVEEFRLEDEAVKLSRQVGDRYVVEIFGSAVLSHGDEDSTFKCLYERCRNNPEKSVERKLHTSILCNYESISNLGVTEDFIDAIGQIMTCLHIIDKKQIRHRDVSMTNITYYRIGDEIVAVLIDFDSATYPPLNLDTTSDYRAGTTSFMAYELMSDSKCEHALQHDLESCIHCIFWNGAGYSDIKRSNGEVLKNYPRVMSFFRDWRVGSWKKMGLAKNAFYTSMASAMFVNYLRKVNAEYSDICQRLTNLLGAEYYQCQERGMERNDEVNYLSVPQGFRLTYNLSMKALKREESCNDSCCQWEGS